jgi:hypothetical protein
MARKPRLSLREAWGEQQAKMATMQADRGSPEARRSARIGGLVMIGLGLVLGAAMAVGFWQAGRIYIWLAAVPVALLIVGVWSLITGKLPKRRR